MFLAAIRRGKFEPPFEGDRIGLWLTVDRENKGKLEPSFFGTAIIGSLGPMEG